MERVEAESLVVDTDVLVANLRGKDAVLRDLADKALSTTVVNAFELFHGAYRSRESVANLSSTRGLLSTLGLLDLDAASAERAGQVLSQLQKSGETIEVRDLLVGCIARENDRPLLTFNVKHFQRIPGLRVVDAKGLSGT